MSFTSKPRRLRTSAPRRARKRRKPCRQSSQPSRAGAATPIFGALHAFARLAGVAPVPASSGQTLRHRLSRGGDRQFEPRAAHHRPPPTSARSRDTEIHRTTRRRRHKQTRRDPAPQALPRPSPLPTTTTNRAADDLTDHRSVIADSLSFSADGGVQCGQETRVGGGRLRSGLSVGADLPALCLACGRRNLGLSSSASWLADGLGQR
jgi:Transposase IS116/IS110/IS902 family